MHETAVDRVRLRRKELSDEIAKLEEERARLDAFLIVYEEFTRPSVRTIAGREIDALCLAVLRDSQKPMTPAQLVDELKRRFGAEIEAANPARLVSTRMSTLASVRSTEQGWRLVLPSITPESEAYG